MARQAAEIKCEIVQHLCVLEERNAGWNLEFNIVRWNEDEPKYDIRPWNEDHSKCGKGITLTEDNLKALVGYCNFAQLSAI